MLRISSSGSETGHHMPPKDNPVTNFDLKANFSPFIIGEDKGGNPLPPPSGDHSYIDLGTLHKEQALIFQNMFTRVVFIMMSVTEFHSHF